MSHYLCFVLPAFHNRKKNSSEIVASIHQERAASADPLFSRQYRFPIFLAITVGMFCQLSGINAILYYLNDIFALAGATKVSGALQAVAVGATNLVATLAAMSVIDQFGRRKLLLAGHGRTGDMPDSSLLCLYDPSTPALAGVAAHGVYRLFRHIAGCCDLGLCQRGIS